MIPLALLAAVGGALYKNNQKKKQQESENAERQARINYYNSKAAEKDQDFGYLLQQINSAFSDSNSENGASLKLTGGDGATGDAAGQSQGSGLSRKDMIRMAVKAKYGIDIPKTQQELQQENSRKIEQDITKNELETMSKQLPKLDQAYQSIGQLEDLYNKGATPDQNPIMARLTGIPDAVRAKMGFNPNLNSYMNNRKAFAGLIAKGGFGESGMLTNQDIERVVSALPSSGSTPDEAKLGFAEVKKLLGAARDRFENTKRRYTGGESSGFQQVSEKRVRVKSPDGKTGSVPESQLEGALAKGYEVY